MITIGWFIGMILGGVLGAGLLAGLSLLPAISGPLLVLLGPVAPMVAPFVGILSIPIAMMLGSLALFVVTIMAYALAAVSLGGIPVGVVVTVTTNPIELINRGILIGLTTAANSIAVAMLTGMPTLTLVVIIIGLLATIPPVAANRGVFQPILGFFSWLMPMMWVVMPFGVVLFSLNLPLALAQSGGAALRFDFSTFTIETSGGALLNGIIGLSPGTGGFNLGNFTFLRCPVGTAPAVVQTGFGAAGISAHETGHTLTVAALGGFFGWINAVDENIPPLRRRAAAYGEIIPESHGSTGGPVLPMW